MKIVSRLVLVSSLSATLLVENAASAQSPATERVSIATAGTQGNSASYAAAISGDGRFVAFQGSATNLVPGITNGNIHIYVRDRTNATTECASVSSGGASGDSSSLSACLTADGRFVAFYSYATNLVAGDTNSFADIFVRDRTNGTTERVSLPAGGGQANADSAAPSISAADGRFVAFHSVATILVAGDSNMVVDCFVRDRTNSTTERVSIDSSGTQGNAPSYSPSISADGHFVAFESNSSNLVASDTNGVADVFVRDRIGGTTARVSVSTAGAQGNGSSDTCSISGDGRFVAFQSTASNLVLGDTNGSVDVFVRDRTNGTTERVSVTTAGIEGNAGSDLPSISLDGRSLAFESLATNLVAGDTNGVSDIFLRDRISATTTRLSIDSASLQGNAASLDPSTSSDGRFVAFDGGATNLVAGDTNALGDAFVRDRGVALPTSYCTAGTTSIGCIASLTANANPSVSLAHACNIAVTNVEGLKSGILFYGIDNTGFTPGPWALGSTSLLCVKHPTQRTPIQSSGGTSSVCNGTYALDWNAYQSAHPLSLGNPWSIGDRVYVQAWFRDPPAAKSTNLSDAVEMTYQP